LELGVEGPWESIIPDFPCSSPNPNLLVVEYCLALPSNLAFKP